MVLQLRIAEASQGYYTLAKKKEKEPKRLFVATDGHFASIKNHPY